MSQFSKVSSTYGFLINAYKRKRKETRIAMRKANPFHYEAYPFTKGFLEMEDGEGWAWIFRLKKKKKKPKERREEKRREFFLFFLIFLGVFFQERCIYRGKGFGNGCCSNTPYPAAWYYVAR